MCGGVGRSKESEAQAGGRVVLAPASDNRLPWPWRQLVALSF